MNGNEQFLRPPSRLERLTWELKGALPQLRGAVSSVLRSIPDGQVERERNRGGVTHSMF